MKKFLVKIIMEVDLSDYPLPCDENIELQIEDTIKESLCFNIKKILVKDLNNLEG